MQFVYGEAKKAGALPVNSFSAMLLWHLPLKPRPSSLVAYIFPSAAQVLYQVSPEPQARDAHHDADKEEGEAEGHPG